MRRFLICWRLFSFSSGGFFSLDFCSGPPFLGLLARWCSGCRTPVEEEWIEGVCEPSRGRLTGATDQTQDMHDQQPKTNCWVRQHPQPAAQPSAKEANVGWGRRGEAFRDTLPARISCLRSLYWGWGVRRRARKTWDTGTVSTPRRVPSLRGRGDQQSLSVTARGKRAQLLQSDTPPPPRDGKRSADCVANWVAEKVWVCTGTYSTKCWERKITTVPGTSSPWGGETPVIHHPIRDLSAHLASAAQRHRMLSPCLFTAPAWNSNPTPKERLGCADAVATARESSWETRKERGVPTPVRSWGSPLKLQGTVLETRSSESQPAPARALAITQPSRRLPAEIREAAAIPWEEDHPYLAAPPPPSWCPGDARGGFSPGPCWAQWAGSAAVQPDKPRPGGAVARAVAAVSAEQGASPAPAAGPGCSR